MPTPRAEQLRPSDSYLFRGTPGERHSPLQNRVLPSGEIVADPARGTLMGNRGSIHRPDRTLGVTRWRSPMWISCVLEWGRIRRDVMPPGRWTALFFLDEATALSAGHRPCGYCRYDDHRAFGSAWMAAFGLARRPRAHEMDLVLHRQRVSSRRVKLTSRAPVGDLPNGAMIGHGAGWALVLDGRLLPWTIRGYSAALETPPRALVEVFTPPAIVQVLRAGYRAGLHPSAGSPRQ
ncbi:MAG TPA: hypothetical protein VHO01_14120 [Jatrophihabitans sp.]|nr:hypothetical protein [Jatrophihabitans sp.]